MELNTTSQVISFASRMEEETALLYDTMAGDGPASEILTALASESRKNARQIERVYYGAITDALEGCFAFKIDEEAYSFKKVSNPGNTRPSLNDAVSAETRAQELYRAVAEQSASLLADLHRLFKTLARRRQERIERLRSLPG